MPAACGTCVAGSCCAEAKKCDPSSMTPCGTLLACILQASTSAAIIQCEMTNSSGMADLTALEGCVDGSKCVGGDTPPGMGTAAACTGSFCFTNTIGYQNPNMDPNVDACNACLGSECCDEFSALTIDVANDPACTGSCVEFTDLQACLEDPTGCMGGAHAKAAAQCQDMKCQATCGVPICDSGIQQSGSSAFDCVSCLDTNCCMEFEASQCSPTPGAACSTWLDDFNMCSAMDMTCNGDMSAAAAFACQTTNCNTQCGGM